MQELHGIIIRDANELGAELKQKLLLFDHLHVIGFDKFVDDLQSESNPDSQALAVDLSFLAAHNIVEPVTNETITNAVEHGRFLKLPPDVPRPTGTLADQFEAMSQEQLTAYLALPETKALMHRLMGDVMARCAAIEIGLKRKVATAPICNFQYLDHLLSQPMKNTAALDVAMRAFPLPGEDCAIQDILDFKQEMRGEQWDFRRFLRDLAIKRQTIEEVRDDFEWTMNEYTEAMKRRRVNIIHSAVSACVIPAVDLFFNPPGNHLLSITAGALAINKLRIELIEGEAKAPGRECAYMFEAHKRFG